MDYRDASRPVPERVQDLLGRMTTEEKIGQLIQPMGWKAYVKEADGTVQVTEAFKRDIADGGVGSLYGALRADPWTEVTLETGLSPRQGAEAMNEIQRYAIEHSRLGIPVLFGEECSHGHMAIGATVFPVPLLVGSTWNPALYRQMCEAIALETRSQGGAVTYSPVLDVVRDPRWGRTEECFAEDPYLIGELAVAAVEGLQGERLDSPHTIAATLKHFAAYGSSEGGRNAAPVHMGMRELHEIDLLPFKKAVEAGACSVMTAYNEIDGVPCTSSTYLLNDVLREQWGFEGVVITDFGAIQMLVHGHNTAENGEQAAAQALTAGVDMEMSGYMFRKHLKQALEQGFMAEHDLDQAVSRVLELKFRLGLFEQPFVDPAFAEQVIGCEAHKELARQVAREGMVLLKNENGTLPLAKKGYTLAVIGPNANHVYNQLGDYTSPQPKGQVVTVLEGIRANLASLGEEAAEVLYAPGCRIKGESREGFAQALGVAERADAIVMVMGGSSARDFGEGTIDLRTGASVVTDDPWNDMECGEGIDRSSLHLTGVQLELVQEVHKLGKPVIVVYINGRPIAEPWIDEHAHAILEAWYPGQEGGNAVADILFGDASPSGRLSVSVPKHVGQLPVVYHARRTRGKRYLEMELAPQYPFGFGLSYTTFDYVNVRVTPEVIGPDEEAELRVEVSNIGTVAGTEVVQLYVTDVTASVTRPELALGGFSKIELEPGQTQTVTLKVGFEQLSLVDSQLRRIVEPGEFRLKVGRHSQDGIECTLRVQNKGGEA